MSEIQSAPAPLNKPVPSTGSGRRDRRGSDGGNALFSSAALVPALLASSCCIPQLVLNFFSFSCMGFAILTPFRCADFFRNASCARIQPSAAAPTIALTSTYMSGNSCSSVSCAGP